jgi:cytochrome c oxidase cbb3-type subunit 3
LSAGKAVFSDNCAACHQAGGQGKVGFFPNLTDDDWLHGGGFDKINQTLTKGRRGYMPAFGEALDQAQIDELAHYVFSLSGGKSDTVKASKGKELFHSEVGACFYCHGDNAKGIQSIGSANLTDKVWLWADVPGSADDIGKVAAIKKVITGGLNKGVMPAWEGRLNAQQIKLLTVYVHELGGGK